MAKFLSGNALNAALDKILDTAQERLVLISPFIKLHQRVKSSLLVHRSNPKLEIIVVFGKNEDKMHKSISREDLDFLCEFLNIKVLYAESLHAKYYANEFDALITSMNLYEYSQNNNIEAGILTEYKILGSNSLDYDASIYFQKVIDQAKIVFESIPEYEKSNLGLTKKFIKPTVKQDNRDEMFALSKAVKEPFGQRPSYNKTSISSPPPQKPKGYCIRTGVSISFNQKHPMCDDAYKSWHKYSNPDFAEKFCHFSGEASNGATSFGKPILWKNWPEAKKVHNL